MSLIIYFRGLSTHITNGIRNLLSLRVTALLEMFDCNFLFLVLTDWIYYSIFHVFYCNLCFRVRHFQVWWGVEKNIIIPSLNWGRGFFLVEDKATELHEILILGALETFIRTVSRDITTIRYKNTDNNICWESNSSLFLRQNWDKTSLYSWLCSLKTFDSLAT